MEFLNRFIRQNIRPDEETDDDETDSAEESSAEVSSEEEEEESSEEVSSEEEEEESSEEEEESAEEEGSSSDEEEEEDERNTNDSDYTSKVSEESSSASEYYSSSEEDEEEGGEEKKSEESKSYEEMKEKFNNVIREKRVGLPKKYNGTEPQNSERGEHKKIEDEERKEWYKMLQNKKNKFKLNIELPFATVNQKGTNACSFLGFSLLCWLKNKDVFKSIYKKKTWENLVNGNWKNEWEKVKNKRQKGSDKGGGMNNIGQMLDTVLKTYPFNTTNLVYIPIRGTNDNNYNPDVVKKGTEYPNHLEKIEKYIENIIDTNKYLIMNTDQHTRVYFSYNDTHLLAIDSYPINQKQIRRKNNDTILDETKGGISKVNKFFVYRNVRDLAYFK